MGDNLIVSECMILEMARGIGAHEVLLEGGLFVEVRTMMG